MSAVDRLLRELQDLDDVVDYLGRSATQSSPAVVSTLNRGLAVAGLVAFEQFVRERGAEWSSALTSARISPTTWPGGQTAIQERLVQTLPRTYRDLPAAHRQILIDEIGKTFSSLGTSSLVGHAIKFAWIGSNVQASDLEAVLSMAGLSGNAWAEMTSLWSRVDPRYPGNLSARSLFNDFTTLRHDAAHSSRPLLAAANLASITRNVRLMAMLMDALMTACLTATVRGVTVKTIKGGNIPVRKVIRDGSKWREFGPHGSKRARARHDNLVDALSRAAVRASPGAELVMALDGNDIVNWRTAM